MYNWDLILRKIVPFNVLHDFYNSLINCDFNDSYSSLSYLYIYILLVFSLISSILAPSIYEVLTLDLVIKCFIGMSVFTSSYLSIFSRILKYNKISQWFCIHLIISYGFCFLIFLMDFKLFLYSLEFCLNWDYNSYYHFLLVNHVSWVIDLWFWKSLLMVSLCFCRWNHSIQDKINIYVWDINNMDTVSALS